MAWDLKCPWDLTLERVMNKIGLLALVLLMQCSLLEQSLGWCDTTRSGHSQTVSVQLSPHKQKVHLQIFHDHLGGHSVLVDTVQGLNWQSSLVADQDYVLRVDYQLLRPDSSVVQVQVIQAFHTQLDTWQNDNQTCYSSPDQDLDVDARLHTELLPGQIL